MCMNDMLWSTLKVWRILPFVCFSTVLEQLPGMQGKVSSGVTQAVRSFYIVLPLLLWSSPGARAWFTMSSVPPAFRWNHLLQAHDLISYSSFQPLKSHHVVTVFRDFLQDVFDSCCALTSWIIIKGLGYVHNVYFVVFLLSAFMFIN